ncbi:MAG TPA: molybdopterin-binding/glycosyltransferase family 2 protein [Beijerinckiaceae bacterium]|nr:molybdopterin-binding/glycosyltransferase family 2 protein [Beijerinckiaceae bacterium]
MKFGSVPVAAAVGGILAHAVRQGGVVLRKGTRLRDNDVLLLEKAGVREVVIARLEEGDVDEDSAALAIAETLAGGGVAVERPFTGRANLTAEAAGVFRVNAEVIHALNGIDGAITVATLPDFRAVRAGEMVATVKIIPFAVDHALVNGAILAAGSGNGALSVTAFRPGRVALISTTLPGLKASVIDKTAAVTAARLAAAGTTISADQRVPHEMNALADALARQAAANDVVIVFGASAITDLADVIPAAIRQAGGRVDHFGMPVDPGNLLLVGRIGDARVIGAPGCARSPKENGFDWVLQRMLAGFDVTRFDIQAMGVGGLLTEIASRPHLREPRSPAAPTVIPAQASLGVIVLAAGRSTRMEGANKLLLPVDGVAMVRRSVEVALAAGVGPVSVVTGHEADRVMAALAGLPVRFVANADFVQGMATSLRAGLAAQPEDVAGVLVMLADMPLVAPAVLQRLAGVFGEHPGVEAVVPTLVGERGNPVLIGRALFGRIAGLTGDQGARKLIEAAGADVIEVPVEDAGIARDFDTPEAFGRLKR